MCSVLSRCFWVCEPSRFGLEMFLSLGVSAAFFFFAFSARSQVFNCHCCLFLHRGGSRDLDLSSGKDEIWWLTCQDGPKSVEWLRKRYLLNMLHDAAWCCNGQGQRLTMVIPYTEHWRIDLQNFLVGRRPEDYLIEDRSWDPARRFKRYLFLRCVKLWETSNVWKLSNIFHQRLDMIRSKTYHFNFSVRFHQLSSFKPSREDSPPGKSSSVQGRMFDCSSWGSANRAEPWRKMQRLRKIFQFGEPPVFEDSW